MEMRSTDVTEVQVSINGNQILGLLRASIASTNCFSADTFSLTFAIGTSGDVAFWSIVSSGYVEVTAAISSVFGITYQALITGMIDTIHVDPSLGTVGVEGRDLSSLMVDSYRQQDFVNQTASEIVSSIAQSHNLQPFVTATSGNVGRYYSDGYTKLSLGQFSRLRSDWDLVVMLARQMNFDVFVECRSLYFQPANAFGTSLTIPVSLRDVQGDRIERNLNITRSSVVKVQSWNSQHMTAYSSDGSAWDAAAAQSSSATNAPFLFSAANYTSQQVTDSAQRYATEVSRLGTVLRLNMPWDLSFSPRAMILLNDTNSLFDTTYLIDGIERHYSPVFGSKQLVRAVPADHQSFFAGVGLI
jgi:hypothetical protein